MLVILETQVVCEDEELFPETCEIFRITNSFIRLKSSLLNLPGITYVAMDIDRNSNKGVLTLWHTGDYEFSKGLAFLGKLMSDHYYNYRNKGCSLEIPGIDPVTSEAVIVLTFPLNDYELANQMAKDIDEAVKKRYWPLNKINGQNFIIFSRLW